jgi:H+/Cl- antiporter ClcA
LIHYASIFFFVVVVVQCDESCFLGFFFILLMSRGQLEDSGEYIAMADPLHSINSSNGAVRSAQLLRRNPAAIIDDDDDDDVDLYTNTNNNNNNNNNNNSRRNSTSNDDGGSAKASRPTAIVIDDDANSALLGVHSRYRRGRSDSWSGSNKDAGAGATSADELTDEEAQNDDTSLSFKQVTTDRSEVKDLYESLDYDPMENFVYSNSLAGKTLRAFARENVWKWVVVILIGAITALFALAIDYGVTTISEFKFSLTRNIIAKCGDCFILPLFTYICSNLILVSVASVLVAFVEPVAGGSGIPEIKCYLNGVRVPRVVRLRTLLAKAVGIAFSVAGGLPCGKEGPMIHTGAIVAAGMSQGQAESIKSCKRLPLFQSFRNDNDKRDFVSSGAAAGVAAAFGAPVGGVLFALEEGSSFWNQALTWRTFACATFCSFTLNVLASGLLLRQWGNLSTPGLATFGSFTQQGNPGYTLIMIPFFLVLGALGGLIGALFITVNHRLTLFRTKYIKSPWARMLEALIVSCIVSSASFSLSYFARDCVPIVPTCAPVMMNTTTTLYEEYIVTERPMNLGLAGNALFGLMASAPPALGAKRASVALPPRGDEPLTTSMPPPTTTTASHEHSNHCIEEVEPNQFDYFCQPGEYNAMARIFFTTSEKAIRNLFHSEGVIGFRTLSIFFVVYISLACLTYGIAVPSGLFVPAILSGCALGRLLGLALKLALPAYRHRSGRICANGRRRRARWHCAHDDLAHRHHHRVDQRHHVRPANHDDADGGQVGRRLLHRGHLRSAHSPQGRAVSRVGAAGGDAQVQGDARDEQAGDLLPRARARVSHRRGAAQLQTQRLSGRRPGDALPRHHSALATADVVAQSLLQARHRHHAGAQGAVRSRLSTRAAQSKRRR